MLVETYAGDAPLRPAKKLAMPLDARVPVEPILGTRCLRCRLAGPLRSSSINGVVNVKPLSNCNCCRSPAGIIETRKKVTQTATARRGTYVSTKVSASWRRGTSIRRQSSVVESFRRCAAPELKRIKRRTRKEESVEKRDRRKSSSASSSLLVGSYRFGCEHARGFGDFRERAGCV